MKTGSLYAIQQKTGALFGSCAARIGHMAAKRPALYSGLLFAVSMIPIFILGRYNVMCIDDYDYGRQIHDTWAATGSLWQSVQSAWRQSMEFYRSWQGTFVSCFLMGMCPMHFDHGAAWIVPVIMTGMFSVSVFALGRQILCGYMGVGRSESGAVLFLLLFMFYQVMEAPFEGIYWYNGSVHYVFMQSVWFLALTFILAALRAQSRTARILLCMAASALSVIVGGGNLITGLQAQIVTAFLAVYAAVKNRGRIMAAAVPFITGITAFMINVAAPGNRQRSMLDQDVGYGAVTSVLLSFYHAAVFMIQWTPVFVILIWLALLPFLWKMMKKAEGTFRYPAWVTVGAVCLLAAMFTPTLYAVRAAGLARVDNIIQMVYYLCLFLVTAYWCGYFTHRRTRCGGGAPERETDGDRAADLLGAFFERTEGKMTVVCLLAVLVIWVGTADKNTYTSISALRSLVNGEAETFYAQSMERYDVYTDDTVSDVEVKPYSVKPALFDYTDLTTDPGNWVNLGVAQYYHKASVKVVEE